MAIYKRKEDGKWRVQVYYKKSDGTKAVVNRTTETRKKAVELEALLTAQYRNISTVITFSAVASEFIKEAKDNIRASTLANYKKFLRLFLLPEFENKEMAKITSDDINEWKKKMVKQKSKATGKPFSIRYLNHAFVTLQQVYKFALKKYGINDLELRKTSQFKEPPNKVLEEEPLHYWKLEDIQLFLNTIDKEIQTFKPESFSYTVYQNVKTMIAVLFFAGLRKGEANSLLITDFHDGENPFLKVRTSLSQKVKLNNNSSYLITNPKNRSSMRDVPIPELLADIIRDHIEMMKKVPGYNENKFFLIGGARPVPDTTLENIKNKMEKKAGLTHIRVHDLRHSYATMLINCGISINVISNLLGHSSTEITWKVYSHLYPKTKNEAVSKIDDLLKDYEVISN